MTTWLQEKAAQAARAPQGTYLPATSTDADSEPPGSLAFDPETDIFKGRGNSAWRKFVTSADGGGDEGEPGVPYDIQLTPETIDINYEDRATPIQMTAVIVDFFGDPVPDVVVDSWSCDPPEVATIDEDGLVTFTGVGSACVIFANYTDITSNPCVGTLHGGKVPFQRDHLFLELYPKYDDIDETSGVATSGQAFAKTFGLELTDPGEESYEYFDENSWLTLDASYMEAAWQLGAGGDGEEGEGGWTIVLAVRSMEQVVGVFRQLTSSGIREPDDDISLSVQGSLVIDDPNPSFAALDAFVQYASPDLQDEGVGECPLPEDFHSIAIWFDRTETRGFRVRVYANGVQLVPGERQTPSGSAIVTQGMLRPLQGGLFVGQEGSGDTRQPWTRIGPVLFYTIPLVDADILAINSWIAANHDVNA